MGIQDKHKDLVGVLGENIAANSLVRLGHTILKRNYRKKYGEIDIISYSEGKIVFTEVKTSQYYGASNFCLTSIPEAGEYEPDLRVTSTKVRRIRRVIQVFMEEFSQKFIPEYKNILQSAAQSLSPHSTEFTCTVISVKINLERGVFKLRILKDVVV